MLLRMRVFSVLILLLIGGQILCQDRYGFGPDGVQFCIENNNLEQTMDVSFSIDSIYFVNGTKNIIDSFFIDELSWEVTDGSSILYLNNTPVNFPIKLETNINYNFILKVSCGDEVSLIVPTFKSRIYKNNSPVALELDNELYEFLFDDTLHNLSITTRDYKFLIANDSVCSTMSEGNFKISAKKGELDYTWLFNDEVISNADSFFYSESGTVKLETTLAVNGCPAESKFYKVFYEIPPTGFVIKKDVWNTSILLDYFDTLRYPDFKTLWYRDNELYTQNTTRLSVTYPDIGKYYAVLLGKACKETTNSLEVEALASIEVKRNNLVQYISIQENKIHVLEDLKLIIYTIEGKKVADKKMKRGEVLYLDSDFYILYVETEYTTENFKISIQ